MSSPLRERCFAVLRVAAPSTPVLIAAGPLKDQQNVTFSVMLGGPEEPDHRWVKMGDHERLQPLGVAHEAVVLDWLGTRLRDIPRVVAFSRDVDRDALAPWIMTEDIRGVPMAGMHEPPDDRSLQWLVEWLQEMASVDVGRALDLGAAHGVFAPRVDLGQLLEESRHTMSGDYWSQRLLDAARADAVDRTCRVGMVHGSFDARNVLVTRKKDHGSIPVGVIDFESARIGPMSFDIAGMFCSLAMEFGVEPARRWLHLAAKAWGEQVLSSEVLPFVAVRVHHRQQVRAISAAEVRTVTEAALG